MEPWDVVPVFYGTDRVRQPAGASAIYGPERARRLELGRALVTVPKAHQLPLIERPWTYRLPFTQIVLHSQPEDPRQHFTLKDVRPLTKEEFLQLIAERLNGSSSYKDHALIFVHGFNTSFEYALYRTAQIAYDIKFDGVALLYSWPSKGALTVHDYSHDRESAGQAEPYLREFLELVARDTGAKSVSIIAHSMGNQLLLPALRDLRRMAPANVTISQVILAAPDVDRDAFENIARELAGVSRGVTMLAAGNDVALDISRRFWGGVPRAGDVPPEGPLVTEGIDTIDITAVSTKVFALNHSGYADTNALLSDIQLLIQTGERPPDKRIPILERIKTCERRLLALPEVMHTLASDPKARLALVGEGPCSRVGRKMAGVIAGLAVKLQRQTLSLAAVRHASQERPSASAREHIDTAPRARHPPIRSAQKLFLSRSTAKPRSPCSW